MRLDECWPHLKKNKNNSLKVWWIEISFVSLQRIRASDGRGEGTLYWRIAQSSVLVQRYNYFLYKPEEYQSFFTKFYSQTAEVCGTIVDIAPFRKGSLVQRYNNFLKPPNFSSFISKKSQRRRGPLRFCGCLVIPYHLTLTQGPQPHLVNSQGLRLIVIFSTIVVNDWESLDVYPVKKTTPLNDLYKCLRIYQRPCHKLTQINTIVHNFTKISGFFLGGYHKKIRLFSPHF